jgi:hypothetical protein
MGRVLGIGKGPDWADSLRVASQQSPYPPGSAEDTEWQTAYKTAYNKGLQDTPVPGQVPADVQMHQGKQDPASQGFLAGYQTGAAKAQQQQKQTQQPVAAPAPTGQQPATEMTQPATMPQQASSVKGVKVAGFGEESRAGMTVDEIKSAVDAGKTVYWSNPGYKVIKDSIGQYLICFTPNKSCIGLTWTDGVTLNGKEEEFYVAEEEGPSETETETSYASKKNTVKVAGRYEMLRKAIEDHTQATCAHWESEDRETGDRGDDGLTYTERSQAEAERAEARMEALLRQHLGDESPESRDPSFVSLNSRRQRVKTAALDPLKGIETSEDWIGGLEAKVSAVTAKAADLRQQIATSKEHGLGANIMAQELIGQLAGPLGEVERYAGLLKEQVESAGTEAGGAAYHASSKATVKVAGFGKQYVYETTVILRDGVPVSSSEFDPALDEEVDVSVDVEFDPDGPLLGLSDARRLDTGETVDLSSMRSDEVEDMAMRASEEASEADEDRRWGDADAAIEKRREQKRLSREEPEFEGRS